MIKETIDLLELEMMMQGLRQTFSAQKYTFCQSLPRNAYRKFNEKRQCHLRCVLMNQHHHLYTKTLSIPHNDPFLKKRKVGNPQNIFQCGFRTSSPNRVHPLLLALLKPLSRIVPMIAGRKIRKWWKNLSDSEKLKFKEAKKKYIYILGGK